jgi:hypothetical protein
MMSKRKKNVKWSGGGAISLRKSDCVGGTSGAKVHSLVHYKPFTQELQP